MLIDFRYRSLLNLRHPDFQLKDIQNACTIAKWLKLVNLLCWMSPRVQGTKRGRKTIATQIITSDCYPARLVTWFLNLGYSSSCHSVTFAYMYLRWTWKEVCVALNSIAVYLPPVASTCLSKELPTNLKFYEFPQQRLCITEQCPRCWHKTSSTPMSWPHQGTN